MLWIVTSLVQLVGRGPKEELQDVEGAPKQLHRERAFEQEHEICYARDNLRERCVRLVVSSRERCASEHQPRDTEEDGKAQEAHRPTHLFFSATFASR